MIKDKMKQLVGKSIKAYNNEYSKPKIDELKFKEQYQGRIIDCMVGEVDDNYIETPETDNHIVKLEHSKEGIVKIPSIKGKTILVDSEGNETNTPGEGCRLVSVGEEEDNKLIILSNKGANIWNGKIVNESETDFIRILGNDVTITMPLYRKEEGACYIRVDIFDKNKNKTRQFLMGDNYKRQSYSLTQDEFYIKVIGVRKEVPLEVTLENLPFLLHTSPNLVPIGNAIQHKTEILLDEPLRSLPNGVCDEIVGNKIIRRVGIRIFDGGEDWNGGLVSDNLFRCHTYDFDGVKHNGLISNIFAENHWEKGFYIHPHKLVYCTIENVTSVAEFKEWMSIKKPTLLYELAEPIIEELPNSINLQGFDDTTMYIENSLTPTVSYGYNALIPYKEELSKQKEEVETNTLDIENNIVPYLMDMEYNLMLMEDE